MNEKMTWFWNWEKKIWGDRVETNRYFATLCIMFAAIIGACVGGGNIFHAWFNWKTDVNLVTMGFFLIMIWGCNLCESIIASQTALTALWRSLLILVCLAGAFAAGVVTSVVVIVLVIAWLALLALSIFASGGRSRSSGSSSGSSDEVEQYGYDENGSQFVMRDRSGGYARDDDGRRWKNDGGSKWSLDE